MSAKVLIIEDDPDLRRGLGIRLKAAGYDVSVATDGTSAIGIARDQPPDVVLLDLGLPAGDGYSVMERMRRLTGLSRVPFVVLTGRDRVAHEARALAAGASAFLTKPPENEELLRVIAEQLKGRGEGGDAGPRPTILIVEDDSDTRAGLAVRMEARGFRVVEASDAASAVPIAVREDPSLVLLDLSMPAGDGFQLLERFRTHGKLSTIPIIVVSARDAAANRDRALEAGAVDYFQKPADNEKLLAAIRKAISGG